MAANDVDFYFDDMSEEELRQYVEANPGSVNDGDVRGHTPLIVAAGFFKSVPLTQWLVKEKGADVNAADENGYTPPHLAQSLDVLEALLDCGADPTLQDRNGMTILMGQLLDRRYDLVARLLQDPRVQASVHMQDSYGRTSLYLASIFFDHPEIPAIVHLLLQAGADPICMRAGIAHGATPLNMLQYLHPTHPTTLVLLEQSLDAEKASFLVKARRLVIASTRTTPPTFLQGRVACGLPLPRVALTPVTGGPNNDEIRTTLGWLVGMEGGGMPRDVFRVVLDLLMPCVGPVAA